MTGYTITKRFGFSAAHSLPGLPPEHKCHREHGHNYVVELVLSGEELDSQGMVVDYAALGVFRKWIDTTLDHRNLNPFMERYETHRQSTAENLAYRLWEVARYLLMPLAVGWELVAVRVQETDNTSAEWHA